MDARENDRKRSNNRPSSLGRDVAAFLCSEIYDCETMPDGGVAG
jgi:hypothetical protein